jgi:DNA-binding transcriptional LysR family regulator
MLNETDLSRADLNLLVLFEAVIDERHVGRTAERLNLSPSAVSHGLGRLRRMMNDPLFLRTPKGVIPTARALELQEPVADLLGRARRLLASAEPFDPATSRRSFTLGAPDGVSAVFLPGLLAELGRRAPGIDVRIRQTLPAPGDTLPERAWRPSFAALESRAMDIAVIPSSDIPRRFQAGMVYEEDFVVAMRGGNALAPAPGLDEYCSAGHLVVSMTGDAEGFVDNALAERGRSRRIAVTVPNFMMAMAILADTDLLSALPRRLLEKHGRRFGLIGAEAPLELPRFRLNAVATKAAMMDSGVAWLFSLLAGPPFRP